jgi:hypothetical protein
MEEISLLGVHTQASEKLFCELVGHGQGALEQVVRELLQQFLCVDGLRLADLQILFFHLLLALVALGLELQVTFVDEWRIAVVVDHAQGLHMAELPISGVVARMVRADGIGFGIRGNALIVGEEHAEVGHAHGHIGDAADGLRQPWAHGDDVSLAGAEDGHGAIRLLRDCCADRGRARCRCSGNGRRGACR